MKLSMPFGLHCMGNRLEKKKEINAVVIDNWISPMSLSEKTGRTIQVMQMQDGKCIPQTDTGSSNSHGTICASILAEVLPEHIHLTGYSCPGDDGRPSLDGVCMALEICLENRPAYISLSIGSENWLETSKLAELTKKLADAGTHIFAACANKGYIAFPAAYPWVTGVRYEPGISGFYREENSPIGCNIVIGDFSSSVLDKMSIENPFFECRTNSMAVPYALGRIVAGGIDLSDLPMWAGAPNADIPAELPMPVVAVTGPIESMKELLALLQRESYQAALLTDRVETDWNHMVLRIGAENLASWVKPLAEAGILLLDIEGGLATMQRYADYTLHLQKSTAPVAYEEILRVFRTEEGGE